MITVLVTEVTLLVVGFAAGYVYRGNKSSRRKRESASASASEPRLMRHPPAPAGTLVAGQAMATETGIGRANTQGV
jgi:hypothetical protein